MNILGDQTVPESMDTIYSMILDDERMSTKIQQRPWQYPEKE
jgi:hypothetical protein